MILTIWFLKIDLLFEFINLYLGAVAYEMTELLIGRTEKRQFSITDTGGPRYMREIGTPKIDSHITNKKTKDYCKLEDWFQKKGHFWIAYT
jgi:hypothetical protein